jgi:hypothetical protein
MLIRRHDKTIIYYVALLGAVLSVFLTNSLFEKLQEKADSRTAQHNESILQDGAINKLKQASDLSVRMDVVESVTKILADSDLEDKSPSPYISFLTSLPKWQLMVLSIAAGVAGYGIFWSAIWSGVVALYALIRGVYYLIGRLWPKCAAADKSTFVQDGRVTFQRNPDRILPLIIKMIVLLTLTLSLLGVVVWQLTSIHL